jgi:hypothetical protein
MTPRAIRRAAQRRAALSASKLLGCTCRPAIRPGQRDAEGVPHVTVGHDDDCPMRDAPTTLIVYAEAGCGR